MNGDTLSTSLEKRAGEGLLRRLKLVGNTVDFCSNDYLGFSRSARLAGRIQELFEEWKPGNGSTGSRLLSGNTRLAEELESRIALFHGSESALLFNSGYDANIGFFSSVPQKGDTILYDELIHASVHDGRRLSLAQSYKFRHNSLEHLEERLKRASGTVYVVVESVYSMDGDFAPLRETAHLCRRYNARLVVDEAHATGVFGSHGRGMVQELGLEKEVFARVHTFGKALGTHGAVVLGSNLLREYLVNFARSFIYTTALPPHSLLGIRAAYEMLMDSESERLQLLELIGLFKREIKQGAELELIPSNSPVQCIIVPGNARARTLSESLQRNGFDVRPILSPTVLKGSERLRICLHTFNTGKEIRDVVQHLVNGSSG